jgi:hypothetical protein
MAALSGEKTLAELTAEFGVHPTMISDWKQEAALGTVDDVITGPVLSRLYGTEIDVVHLKGRIFVMSGGHDLESDPHRHDHESRHPHTRSLLGAQPGDV